MQIIKLILLLLCMSLLLPAAMAEGIVVPDREHRKGMSYEEYSAYREKMRMQMKKMKPDDAAQKPTASAKPADQMEKSQRDSAYGKGYHTRSPPADRPDNAGGTRPEHPRAERFNRGDMGHR